MARITHRKSNKTAGLSLVEVMVASAVVTVGIFVLSNFVVDSRQAINMSHRAVMFQTVTQNIQALLRNKDACALTVAAVVPSTPIVGAAIRNHLNVIEYQFSSSANPASPLETSLVEINSAAVAPTRGSPGGLPTFNLGQLTINPGDLAGNQFPVTIQLRANHVMADLTATPGIGGFKRTFYDHSFNFVIDNSSGTNQCIF